MPRNLRRRRPTRPGLCRLEDRRLLSGPSASWIGQDGQDLVGPYPVEVPDGIQDVRIALSGLDPTRGIASADLQGLGGGRWVYNGPYGPWRAALVRAPGATTADLFIESDRVESGRPFNLLLTFDDGSTADLWFDGGPADPSLRAPSAALKVEWIGQDGADLTGRDLNVGPDGFQDARLVLSQLAATAQVARVAVTGPNGLAWQSGLNPQGDDNAEFLRRADDPSRADLYLGVDRNLAGQTLTVQVVYATGRTDTATVVAGTTDPNRRVAPAPAAPPVRAGVSASWGGQEAQVPAGSGRVRLDVAGLPAGRTVVGATLSGATHESWVYRAPGQSAASYFADPYAQPMDLLAGPDGRAELRFPPVRDESGSRLTLRLQFDDGSIAVASLAGGPADPARLAPAPASSTIDARPGDDLNDLASRFGTVLLAPGEYRLDRPLTLNQAVTLRAPRGGATLVFRQPATDDAWTAAIKIHAGNTTLDGFAVRFDGPIRWRTDVDYGPAVIGTTDNLDAYRGGLKVNVVLTRLDVRSPDPATPGEEAPRVLRLATARSGRVESNTLRGGTTEFLRGPWTIAGNTYLGTVPGTWAWDVFAGHFTHDLVLRGNVVAPASDAGKTWRFLVLTGTGDGDVIEGNTVRGIGQRDTDTVNLNAAEVVLTEAYGLRFEGRPLALSADGRILQVPTPQGEPAGSGDVVAILDGPHAGQWRRIAQALGPTTYLLESPLPAGDYTVSIAGGFVDQAFRANTIDVRGGSVAAGMVLVGNHYGTQVVGNHILGGGEAIRVASFPSERPVSWGWSHNPFLGGLIAGNAIEDALRGLTITVMHGPSIKSNRGRLYLTADVRDNVVSWSDAFAASVPADRPAGGIAIGDPGSIDPGELRLRLAGNLADVPPGSRAAPLVRVDAGTINGRELFDASLPLDPLAPGPVSGLSLVSDTGVSATDLLTRDGRIRIGAAERAAGYEYRVGGQGAYRAVVNPSSFLPAGLKDGAVTVFVRAIDARGRRGPERSFTFTLDLTPPESSAPVLAASSDTGRSSSDGLTRATSLGFAASGAATDRVELWRDWQRVASGPPGTLVDPGPVPEGLRRYTLRRIDAAGNVSDSPAILVRIDTTPPPAVGSLAASPDGSFSFAPTAPDDEYAYRVGDGPWIALGGSTSVRPEGLRQGANVISVVAIDAAGNVGPAASVVVEIARTSPAGAWLGQDGRDLVGPYPVEVPDGIQDIHIALSGLPADRTIVFADVQGLGGSRWQFGGPWGPWKAALVRSPGASTADLYLQPDRVETGRPFQVFLRFDDGSTAEFWVAGGPADPGLRMPGGDGLRLSSAPGPAGPARARFAGQAAARRARALQAQQARLLRLAASRARPLARLLPRAGAPGP